MPHHPSLMRHPVTNCSDSCVLVPPICLCMCACLLEGKYRKSYPPFGEEETVQNPFDAGSTHKNISPQQQLHATLNTSPDQQKEHLCGIRKGGGWQWKQTANRSGCVEGTTTPNYSKQGFNTPKGQLECPPKSLTCKQFSPLLFPSMRGMGQHPIATVPLFPCYKLKRQTVRVRQTS